MPYLPCGVDSECWVRHLVGSLAGGKYLVPISIFGAKGDDKRHVLAPFA